MPKLSRPIAFWTPLPPTKSGIADFGHNLLVHLAAHSQIKIYTSPTTQLSQSFDSNSFGGRIYSYGDYKQEQEDYINIYQIGNDARHLPIYKQALTKPGVVLLHDLSISPMIYTYFINRLGANSEFYSAFEYSEGKSQLEKLFALERQKDNITINTFLKQNYMLRQLLEASHQVVTFLPLAESKLRSCYFVNNVKNVFLGGKEIDASLKRIETSQLRNDLNLSKTSFIIGVFGFVIPSKQIETIIKALNRLRKTHPQVRLLIVGEIMTAYGYDQKIKKLIKEFCLEEYVTFIGYVNDTEFEKYLLAVDSVVVLRNQSNFQMSGIIPRAISASKPLILSKISEWEFLPQDFCDFVPSDDLNGFELEKYLIKLMDDTAYYQSHSKNAENFFYNEGNISITANKIIALIEELEFRDTKSFQQFAKEIRTDLILETSFSNLEHSTQGKRFNFLDNYLKKIPVIGPFLWGIYRYFSIQMTIPASRKSQFEFNSTLVEEIRNLRIQVDILRKNVVQQQEQINSLLKSKDERNNE